MNNSEKFGCGKSKQEKVKINSLDKDKTLKCRGDGFLITRFDNILTKHKIRSFFLLLLQNMDHRIKQN